MEARVDLGSPAEGGGLDSHRGKRWVAVAVAKGGPTHPTAHGWAIGYNRRMHDEPDYDALLVVGFGGPEGPDDVVPFLENVTRGRNVPKERLLEVAGHYQHFGGKSPINDQVRALITALKPELAARGMSLPIYWGNRNWRPMLADTMRRMAEDGVKRALALVLSAYASYSSCRQYRENIEEARRVVGPDAPVVEKVRVFYNHPDFIAANAARLREAIALLPGQEHGSRTPRGTQEQARVVFTAHSIPESMARGCDYAQQLAETCRLTAEAVGIPPAQWRLVYQSRSGRPRDPWLEPDILDFLRALHAEGVGAVVVHPIGFLSDHLEVLYDLDDEARRLADSLGMTMIRAGTVGTHPVFVTMLAKLVEERVKGLAERASVGLCGAAPDVCSTDCCPAPVRG